MVAETSGIPRQIRAALGSAQRDATAAGRSTGQSFASSFGSSLKSVGAVAGVTGGIAAVAGAMKSAISSGMDFTTSLNTMRAVAGASSAQIEKVGQVARQLGTDNQLAATSSVDAAQAMVELAKGGFTVDQSMQAARGTLQLAAAAQISAADAATIQSQALQAFGKDATFAGTASDILANAANQSSAEITDVAMAFQQSGAVANQFGLSMQDTAATIALLANAGIQGSDAGTLLKSTLLALTDTGKPAQAAIDKLGLTVYDAQGKFVGMEQLFGQLQTASKRMTPEMYQAATATLFGSDAARIAGVAAQQGAGGFDKMRDAMGQQGAAAEVAAAKMQGLPGAWEKFKNAAQDAGLAFYDAVQGPLTSAATWASGAIGTIVDKASEIGPKIKDAFANIMDAFQSAGGPELLSGWGERLGDVFKTVLSSVQQLMPVFGKLSEVFAQASAAVAAAGIETLVSALEAASQIVTVAVVPALQLANSLMTSMQPLVVAGVAAWLGFKAVGPALAALRGQVTSLSTTTTTRMSQARSSVTNFTDAWRTSMGYMRQANPQLSAAGAGMRVLGANAGMAARGGVSALAGAFGGPLGLALTGAVIAGGMWASSVSRQKSLTEDYSAALKSLAEEQTNVQSQLLASRGVANDSVYSSLTNQVDAYKSSLDAASKKDAKWTDVLGQTFSGSDWAKNLWGNADDDTASRMDRAASQAKAAKQALADLGITSDDLGRKVAGSAGQWEIFRKQLEDSGSGGQAAGAKLDELRQKYLQQQEAAKRLTPGFTELQAAMQKFSDSTASAADKSNALKNALDALNPARGKQAAMAQFNDTVRQVAESTKEAVDQTQGYGRALIAAGGAINTTSANGSSLQKSLMGIVDATANAAGAGADMADVNNKNQAAFQQLANQYGISIDEIRTAANTLGLTDVNVVVGLRGANETVQGLAAVQTEFGKIPAGQPKIVEVQAGQITKDTRATLEQMGFKLEDIDRNGVKTVRIGANDLASGALNAVLAKLVQTGNTNANPSVVLNDSQFRVADQAARAQLGSLAAQVADPKANLIIDQLVQGKTVSMQQLQQLDQTIADPQVRMEVQKILSNIQLVNEALDRTAQARVAYINAQVTGLNFGDRTPDGGVFRGPGISRASGGPISGPGGPRDDKVLMWGSNGEFMQQSAAVDYYGLKFMDDVNNMRLPRRATGGPVNQRDFDNLARGAGASQPLEGAPYVWGGVNWGDCSGAMSAFARLAAGLDPFGGRFATASMESQLQQMGAVMGRGSTGDLRFGWHNGGPGGGHTSGTLPSGINVEMGGGRGNGQVGGGAAGANDGQHTNFAFFPASRFTQPFNYGATGSGDDAGGSLSRPDSIDSSFSGDTSATSGPKGTSLSERLGNAASAAVSGQVKSLLDVISVNDSPGWLAAINEYESQVENSKKAGGKGSKDKTGYENNNADAQRKYETEKLKRQQTYEAERDKLQDEKDATKDKGRKADIDRKLADLKRAYQDANLAAKQKRDEEKLSSRQQQRVDPGTQRPSPGQDMGRPFDQGGLARGRGYLPKDIVAPERVLSPAETAAFQDGMRSGFAGGDLSVLEGKFDRLIELFGKRPPLVPVVVPDEAGRRRVERDRTVQRHLVGK